jgi:hypothetical protein
LAISPIIEQNKNFVQLGGGKTVIYCCSENITDEIVILSVSEESPGNLTATLCITAYRTHNTF